MGQQPALLLPHPLVVYLVVVHLVVVHPHHLGLLGDLPGLQPVVQKHCFHYCKHLEYQLSGLKMTGSVEISLVLPVHCLDCLHLEVL